MMFIKDRHQTSTTLPRQTPGKNVLLDRTPSPRSLRKRTAVVLGALLAVTTPLAALARDQEEAIDERIPLVLTPTRLPQRLDESPSPITVIDRAMIDATGARRLVDVLRLVPGFHVGNKYNNLATVGYQGLDDEFARRMLLLVDGQRIFQHSRGMVEWNNFPIPLEDIARIEVVRGPDAATYGSNAYEAVINIQTFNPAETRGLFVNSALGSNGIADGFLRYGGNLGDFDYALSLSSKGDSGYDDIRDDRRNHTIGLLGTLPVGANSELKLRTGYSQGDYEIQGSSTPYQRERDFPVTEDFQSLQWRQPLGHQDELVFNTARSHWHYDDRGSTSSDLIPGVTLNVEFEIEESRYETDMYYTRALSEQLRTVAGAGYYHERIRAPYYFDTDSTLSNDVYRVFGHGEYRLRPDLVFNAGAMLEYSDLSDEWVFLPRLTAHYHLDAHHTLRAIYATSSRQPTLYENQGRAVVRGVNVPLTLYRVYATGVDRGGLTPETNQSFELGYFWQPSRFVNLDLRLFQETLSDYIGVFYRIDPERPTILPGNQLLDFGNDNDIDIRGLQAQLDWRNRRGTRAFASYAFTDIDAEGTRFDNGYEKSAPTHTFSLLLNQSLGKDWDASLAYHYQSGMSWYLDDPIDPYHKFDARIAKHFKWGNGRATAELVGTHLLEPVNDYLPTKAWDRGVFFRFSWDY